MKKIEEVLCSSEFILVVWSASLLIWYGHLIFQPFPGMSVKASYVVFYIIMLIGLIYGYMLSQLPDRCEYYITECIIIALGIYTILTHFNTMRTKVAVIFFFCCRY